MNNAVRIKEYLIGKQATVNEVTDYLGVSRQAVHRILNGLINEGSITKIGKPPKVFYSISLSETIPASEKVNIAIINEKARKVIGANFYYVSPTGNQLTGWAGFSEWCSERDQDPVKMSQIYLETFNKYHKFRRNGLIDETGKLKSTFRNRLALNRVFCSDFYSIEIFGKTRLGQELLYSKQSQDRELMNQMIDKVRPAILGIIEKYKIDGIGFIPPTVKRERQLMRQMKQRLKLSVRELNLVKIKTPVIVPQKTLSKLDDRIANAKRTIMVDENGAFNNILLIDDAVGSGATLNETAIKIRNRGICSGKIIGYAVTGSAKGFEVISEV
jgi:transcriptional regulator with XRE-family HTH domain